jgi:hypothetical protein
MWVWFVLGFGVALVAVISFAAGYALGHRRGIWVGYRLRTNDFSA